MTGGRTISLNGVAVLLRGVALMFCKIIGRKLKRQFSHQRIPGNLGHDGGGGDRGAFGLALDQGALRGVHGNGKFSVYQQKIWGKRCGGEVLHGPFHGQKRGLKDIDPINGRGGNKANAYLSAYPLQGFGKKTAPDRGKLFGVNEERKIALPRQHHAGSHHRPGQWSSARLVQSGDTRKTLTDQGAFMQEGIVQNEIISGQEAINPLQRVLQVDWI